VPTPKNLANFAALVAHIVAQKSKPLPNYQNIVLNRIKDCQWD